MAALVAAILASVLALSELKTTRDHGAYLTLNSLFRRHEAVSDSAVIQYARQLEGPIASCRSDIVNAVVSVAQRGADLEFSADRDEWPAALGRLEKVLKSALACSPTNGDLWARLAQTRWLVGGSAAEQLSMIMLSQTYSPANLDTVRKRLGYWAGVTRPMAALGEDLIRRDIRTMLLYAPKWDVAITLRRLPAHLQPLVRSEEAVVSGPRLSELREAGLSPDGR